MSLTADAVAAERIQSRIDARRRAWIERFERYPQLASTNDHLLASAPPTAGKAAVCIADEQTAGRGRRGRAWLAPQGSGICLSVGWTFPTIPQPVASLSLAAGVGVMGALAQVGVRGVGLKWPNDLVRGGGKLGGILAELRIIADGRTHVVVGVGLNTRLPDELAQHIRSIGGQPPTDLSDALGTGSSTDEISAKVIESLLIVLERFGRDGFAPFRDAWQAADVLFGRKVEVHAADTVRHGVADGLSPEGFLRVRFPEGLQSVVAGDVTLRVTE
jgi:BirA family transcriptional regulator, biotin operon repressor / biotin---[acetyl-CoA-carboxylase] ligase